MPQLNKTLPFSLSEITARIDEGITAICPMTYERGRWETCVNGVYCVMMVYEQYAPKVFVRPDKLPEEYENWDSDYKPSWFNLYARDYLKAQPHYSISITLLDDGTEVRLCAITAGSGEEHYFIPEAGAEYALMEALEVTLERMEEELL